RPCFFCRRERATDFVDRFGRAFGIAEPRAPIVDKRLHKERLASGGRPAAVTVEQLGELPGGAMVADGDTAYALRAGKALRWSFAGYGDPLPFDRLAGRPLRLCTPVTTAGVLRQG
ncbi:hypothetical protein EN804_35425, partial [Mesorhizobium sp. M8A.F.Ca.ET.161.01.1.1]